MPLGPWPLVVDNVVVTSAHPGHDGVAELLSALLLTASEDTDDGAVGLCAVVVVVVAFVVTYKHKQQQRIGFFS